MCYDKNVQGILELDQLKQEIAHKRVFQGFKEGEIQFHPTYKVGYEHHNQVWTAVSKHDLKVFVQNSPHVFDHN